jgi:hypothetical protein
MKLLLLVLLLVPLLMLLLLRKIPQLMKGSKLVVFWLLSFMQHIIYPTATKKTPETRHHRHHRRRHCRRHHRRHVTPPPARLESVTMMKEPSTADLIMKPRKSKRSIQVSGCTGGG